MSDLRMHEAATAAPFAKFTMGWLVATTDPAHYWRGIAVEVDGKRGRLDHVGILGEDALFVANGELVERVEGDVGEAVHNALQDLYSRARANASAQDSHNGTRGVNTHAVDEQFATITAELTRLRERRAQLKNERADLQGRLAKQESQLDALASEVMRLANEDAYNASEPPVYTSTDQVIPAVMLRHDSTKEATDE